MIRPCAGGLVVRYAPGHSSTPKCNKAPPLLPFPVSREVGSNQYHLIISLSGRVFMNLFCLPVSRCVLLDFLAFNPVNFGNILFTTSIAILNVFSDFVKNRRNVPLVLLHMNKAQPYSHFFNLLLICRIEAAQCPDVVVAQIDPKKLKRKQSVNVSVSFITQRGIHPFPPPPPKWKDRCFSYGIPQYLYDICKI